ncbi:bacterial [Scheffersomyces amazonensis]|uniref:bacterial n=1 Tax=Scheffersomyces amazonensis TaxID=1078765 RepID=UPI00315CD3E3
MAIKLNWGILGAGNISGQFVHDLLLNNTLKESGIEHVVVSIGSSSKAKAKVFAEENKITLENNLGVTPVFESYDELYANPNVNAVYIGTPHPYHKEQVEASLKGGKHVICEKPFTINSKEAQELFDLAKKKNLFLMEAVWTRFFPSIKLLRKYLYEDKVIGDIHRLKCDFSFKVDFETTPTTHRLRDIKLGGGAILDVGIYVITYARILLDDKVGKNHTPFEVKSLVTLDPVDGVDYNTNLLFKYNNGKQAVLSCGFYVDGPQPFIRLEGTKGYANLSSPNPACPKQWKITFADGSKPIEYEDKSGYNGFIYEANAMAEDIAAGRIENAILPWDETLLTMGIMDDVRKEAGLVYPQEK